MRAFPILLALALAPAALPAQAQVAGDFDNDGFNDVAIGVPKEDNGAIGNCGAVHVLYGETPNLTTTGSQLFFQSNLSLTDEAGDQFGSSLAIGDFNGDGFDDLAVGMPFEDVVGNNQGAVVVIYGSAAGLTATGSQFLTRTGAAANEYFGYSLTAANTTALSGFDELIVGVPGQDVGAATDAGGFEEYLGGSGGLGTATNWNQNSTGIGGVSEANDRFGFALTSGNFNNDSANDVAVGVYFEDFAVTNDGFVNVIYGSAGSGLTSTGNQGLSDLGASGGGETQDRFGASLAAGDFGGDGDDDLAIGVTGENLGAVADAGEVQVYYGASTGIIIPATSQTWSQNTGTVAGGSELNDRFGTSLVSADFDGDGVGDLAVGVPDEDFAAADDGFVNVLYGASGSLSDVGNVGISDTTVEGGGEAGDKFGFALSAADVNASGASELVVAIPFEDILTGAISNAGAMNLRYAVVGTNQVWTQDTAGVANSCEANDRLGEGLPR